MAPTGGPSFITLHPWQVVDSDPDGLLEYEAELLREAMKPKTIYLGTFRIYANTSLKREDMTN